MSEAAFRVDPSIIFQLGESLILDDVQAVVELVKNAYDADATWFHIEINTSGTPEEHWWNSEAHGFIQVADNGVGMAPDTLRTCWLQLGGSPKRAQKERGVRTARGRTPLGDKGIGRLGTQRLGSQLEVISYPHGEDASHLGLSWEAVRSAEQVDNAPIRWEVCPALKHHGTEILITGLRNPAYWTDAAISVMKTRLAGLLAGLDRDNDFHITLNVNGAVTRIQMLADDERSVAPIRHTIEYDEHALTIAGTIDLSRIGPTVVPFSADLAELLRTADQLRAYQPIVDEATQCFSYRMAFSIDEISGLLRDTEVVTSPGPFRGEVDILCDDGKIHVFDRVAKYAAQARALPGVRIYRDGFEIPHPNDWLDSFMSNLPIEWHLTGRLQLSADKNSALVETTSREAFQDSPAFRNFRQLCVHAYGAIHRLHLNLREIYGRYHEQALAHGAGLSPESSSTTVSRALLAQLKTMRDADGHPARDDLDRCACSAELLVRQIERESDRARLLSDAAMRGNTVDTVFHELGRISLNQKLQLRDFQKAAADLPQLDPEARKFIDSVLVRCQYWLRSMASLCEYDPGSFYSRQRSETFSVRDIVNREFEFTSPRMDRDRIAARIVNESDLVVEMNRRMLAQVIQNLVDNSIFWLNDAETRLPIRQKEISVEIRGTHLRFWDNGPGIDPSVEATLFEPFVTTRPRKDGRGLGLFICKQALDQRKCGLTLAPERNDAGRRYIFDVDLSAVATRRTFV